MKTLNQFLKEANVPRLMKTEKGKTVDVNKVEETEDGWKGYVPHHSGYAVPVFVPKKKAR